MNARGPIRMDAISLEILRNRLDAIATQMQVTLLKSAVSVIIKEGEDCACGIFRSNGELLAQACANPVHIGIMGPAMAEVLRRYPASTMTPGDVYLLNDPYTGGTHIPDYIMASPIIVDGEVIALSAALAHQEDTGGKSFGSMPADATEIYQEGLILPPLPLYIAGEKNQPLFDLIVRNVRMPVSLLGDLEAQLSSVKLGVRSFLSAVDELGGKAIKEGMDALFEQSEALMRRGIEQMPDGDYDFYDFCDNDGIDLDKRIRIEATVSIRGSSATVDFTKSSPQVRGPVNVGFWGAYSAVAFAFHAFTDPHIHSNAGATRPIKMIAPPGNILNPIHPAPVGLRTTTAKRVLDVLYGALAQAVPERAVAASSGSLSVCSFGGVHPKGHLFACTDIVAGGMGGRPGKDGIDLIDTDITNSMNIPVEAFEAHYPLKVLKTMYRTDSGGPGEFRGGLGIERTIEATHGPIRCSYRSDRHTTQPWGIEGGSPGQSYRTRIFRKDGITQDVPSKQVFVLNEGDVLQVLSGGGGGYGDPLARSLERVGDDIIDRKVSVEAAERDYGVVADATTLTVDVGASIRLRESRMRERGQQSRAINRGYGAHG
jgi:N-methylhydantoinase B